MPEYENISGGPIPVGNEIVKAKQKITTHLFVEEKNQLKRLSDHPMYNPVALSREVCRDEDVPIPYNDGTGKLLERFLIHIHVVKGYAQVFYSSVDNKPGMLLMEGSKWNERCHCRRINSVHVRFKTPAADNLVIVTVEKI